MEMQPVELQPVGAVEITILVNNAVVRLCNDLRVSLSTKNTKGHEDIAV